MELNSGIEINKRHINKWFFFKAKCKGVEKKGILSS